jgi:hypothetical protein
MENNSPKTIDWAAIRAAYEAGDKPLHVIAATHGVSKMMLARRRAKEAWPRRRDTGRVAPHPEAARIRDKVDWLAVRHEYETGEFSVLEIARRHGCGRSRIQQQRELEHWQLRRPACPGAYGAGGIVAAPQRLKAGLTKKLGRLQARLGLAERIDVGDPVTGFHTLADAIEKLLDEKEKSGDDSNRLHINDATRDTLAERIESLTRAWLRKRDSGEAGSRAADAD